MSNLVHKKRKKPASDTAFQARQILAMVDDMKEAKARVDRAWIQFMALAESAGVSVSAD